MSLAWGKEVIKNKAFSLGNFKRKGHFLNVCGVIDSLSQYISANCPPPEIDLIAIHICSEISLFSRRLIVVTNNYVTLRKIVLPNPGTESY
jgi:hypothetical protein